jgi:hypothetical protein
MILSMVGGILLGVRIEMQHQERKRQQASIDYWRWAHHKDNIESQMTRDGWNL